MIPDVMTTLVLASTRLWELKVDALARKALVDLRVGVKAVVDATTLLLVQHDLEQLLTILLGTQTLADDLDWVDKVVKDSVVDSGEGTRAWTLLLLEVARAVRALWTGQDATGGDDQDMAVGELLLELARQALLHLVPAWQRWNRNEDDNSLATMSNLNLACGHKLKWSQSRLQVRHVRLQVIEGICDGGLRLRWRLPAWAIWRNFVKSSRRHFGGCCLRRSPH